MSGQKSITNDLERAELLSQIDSKKWSNDDALFMRRHVKELEEIMRVTQGLPHLHGFPWYKWAKQVFDSREKEIFLTAANQVSKSATVTRKNIHWATESNIWKELWPGLFPGQKPNLFWYFYPTLTTATTEFETKWRDQYLPRNEFKSDKKYGWKEEYFKGEIFSINFESGVQIQFKSYAQKLKDLQAASVYLITADEELPVEMLPELKSRLNSTDGYFMSAFTATLGQEHWRKTMEPSSPDEELHKEALKLTVSLFDCQFYDDGTPSPWTKEKIKRAIGNCPTEAEVQRRIYGRFVKAHGLRYESFSLEKNMIDPHPIPPTWNIYGIVDMGSGGQSGHPAGIVFLAVSPDYKQGRVFRAWRGDGIPTSAPDVLDKFIDLRGKLTCALQIYDYASADFGRVATQRGEAFIKADKSREAGTQLLNSVFKTGILKLFRGDPEIGKLVTELLALPVDIDKRKAKDDLIDPTRYGCMVVPWDFSDYESAVTPEKQIEKLAPQPPKTEGQLRREWFMGDGKPVEWTIDDEIDYYNDLSGASD